MPLYNFKCKNSHTKERHMSMEEGSNAFVWDDCVTCGEQMKKQLSSTAHIKNANSGGRANSL